MNLTKETSLSFCSTVLHMTIFAYFDFLFLKMSEYGKVTAVAVGSRPSSSNSGLLAPRMFLLSILTSIAKFSFCDGGSAYNSVVPEMVTAPPC